MRIIDANTGTEVQVGQLFNNIHGTHKLIDVEEGLFSTKALFSSAGKMFWVPLQVRYTHPGFFFQKIGFIPS